MWKKRGFDFWLKFHILIEYTYFRKKIPQCTINVIYKFLPNLGGGSRIILSYFEFELLALFLGALKITQQIMLIFELSQLNLSKIVIKSPYCRVTSI